MKFNINHKILNIMKKLVIILLTIHCSLITAHSYSQPCLPEGITFTTQAQIDNFQTNYPNCTEIEGDVEIEGPDISNLEGLISLTALGKGLYIGTVFGDGNPLLTSLAGLDNITSIGESFVICWNNSLTNLTGLDNLTSIQANLSIFRNAALTSLTGLDNVTYIGDLQITAGNTVLASLTGLGNLTSIGQNLQISQMPSLTDLTGLDNLASIGYSVIIIGCDELTSLNGLEKLTYARAIQIGSDVGNLGGNNALTSIEALKNIEAGNISLVHIRKNPSLSTCEVLSICAFLTNPPSNADIEIFDNAPGCNSQQEVEDACGLSVSDIGFENIFTIAPNPFSTTTTISSTLFKHTAVAIEIQNMNGQVVETLMPENTNGINHEFTFDGSGLLPGIYFCTLKTKEGIQTKKMIKL